MDGVDEMFKDSLDKLGPLDDNDPEGEDEEDEDNELEAKLRKFEIQAIGDMR